MQTLKNNFIESFLEFWEFLKNPKDYRDVSMNVKEKFYSIFSKYLLFHVVITLFLIAVLTTFEEISKIKLAEKSKFNDFSKQMMFFGGIVIAPLLEELFFRYPILKLTKKFNTNWIIYIFSIVFGAIHFFNYDLENRLFFLFPVITIVQIYMGFLLSFLRLKFGFWYGVFFHALHNFVLIGPMMLFTEI